MMGRAAAILVSLLLLAYPAAAQDSFTPYDPIHDAVDTSADEECLTRETGTSGKYFEWQACGGAGGAPTDADYLVGTANGSLSAEIAVGTSPGGELGGTWASPTVDATHSGSAHHSAVTLAADADVLFGLSTQELNFDTQTANTIFAGPTTGAAADPTFRALVADDIPDLSGTYLTAETNSLETVATGILDDEVPIGSGAGTLVYKAIPDCDDSGGNHLNYDTATNAISCGTSASGAGGWTDDGASVRLTTAGDDVGIGTATTNAKLTVEDSTAILATFTNSADSGPLTTDGARINIISSNNGGPMSPADTLGGIHFGGRDTISSTANTGAAIVALSDGIWASGDTPANLYFYSTSSGSGAAALRMSVQSAGYIHVGSSGTPGVAAGTGDLFVQDALEVDGAANLAGAVTASGGGTMTGDWDFGGGGIEIENGTAIPGSCTVGQLFLDTDGTSGQQLYGCEGGSFVKQGDGGSGSTVSGSFGITIDGGGSAITTGVKGYIEVPYAMTIDQATFLCDQSGSIVVDVWKDTYANFPPTDADTITASAPPTITTATKSQDTTLTGWTTSVTAEDIIGFNVDSATTVTRCTLIISGDRS